MQTTYKNFIYNAEHGFIFAYVPKVACTNWKSLLRYMAGHDNWLDNRLAHDKQNGGLHYIDLNGPEAALLQDTSIRKYAMVRDPYSRVLSAYLNKIESNLPVTPEPVLGEDHFSKVTREIDRYRREVLGAGEFPKVTFEVFLHWLHNAAQVRDGKAHLRADEHWAPQNVLLLQPEVTFDILGRFENLQEDALRILRAMGCDQDFPTQKDVKFAPTQATGKMKKYYTPVCYALASEIYCDDFKQPFYIEKIRT